jgi:PIN domain nuclease of toxin-antitoxin system
MRLLLDTNVVLWAATEERRLSRDALRALRSMDNERFLSPVTPWELAIKLASGKWEVRVGLEAMIERQIEALRLTELPIRRAHALRILSLGPIHSDPFDRMLIAQALAEDMSVVTADQRFAAYGVDVIW